MKEIIRVEELHKSYGKKKVLKGINFSVNEGEIVGVVGPNGTGKTTLLEILMTLRTFDSGNIKIGGLDIIKDIDKIRRRIGIILQEGGMYAYIKVKEAIDLFGSFYNVSKEEKEKIIRDFELEPYLNTKFSKLSGGWKQRCLLAIAFIFNPDIVFLDEPTTGLDPKASKILWEKIKDNSSTNKTILLSTHSMEEIDKYCDRVIILSNGEIAAFDSPKNLKSKYNKNYFEEVYFHFIEH